jgi:hypothetical protein
MKGVENSRYFIDVCDKGDTCNICILSLSFFGITVDRIIDSVSSRS